MNAHAAVPPPAVDIQVEGALAAQVQPILDDMGVDLAYAVRCLLREFVRDPHLPLQPNQTTIDAMEAGRRGETKTFDSIAAMSADLKSDDEDD